MMLIQYVLAIGALLLTFYFFARRGRAEGSAVATLAFTAFVLLSVFAMLEPQVVNNLAHLLDVGRGADLLIYTLIFAFATGTVVVYFRIQDMQRDYTRLARAVALDRARRENAGLGPARHPTDDPVAGDE